MAINKIQNDFLIYENKINRGQIKSEQEIPNRLKKYSLYPYLELELIKNRLNQNQFDEVKNFYGKYPYSPVARKLNYFVVAYLYNKNRYQEILKYYIPNNNRLIKCLYFSALQKTDSTKITQQDAYDLWLSSESQPKQCNKLFDTWVSENIIPQEIIWERIMLAIKKPNPELALALGKYVSPHDYENLKLWFRVYKNSNLITHSQLFNPEDHFHHKIIIDGLKKETDKNIDKSLSHYRRLHQFFNFSDEDKYSYYSYSAIKMFLRNHPQAESMLGEIPLEYYDEALHTIAIKMALKDANWQLVLKRINQLPENLKKQDIWIYWFARANEELKNFKKAKESYNSIASKVNYYGLLSCRNLKSACPIEFAITTRYKNDVNKILRISGINRAVELFKLNRMDQARLEWNDAIKKMNDKQKFIAATLANELNWHDRSITTMALYEKENLEQEQANVNKIDNAMFLNLKYPMGYKDNILKYAKKYNVDPAWMFAISRQESSFIAKAKSKAGAMGLMQLMPSTAKQVAKHNKIRLPNKTNLLNESTNIHLGAAYLKQMLHQYNGNPIFATAAYNAGPTQVRKWMKINKPMSTDVWIELIPYYETRDYLKRVLTNTAVYRSKLGKAPIIINDQIQVNLDG